MKHWTVHLHLRTEDEYGESSVTRKEMGDSLAEFWETKNECIGI